MNTRALPESVPTPVADSDAPIDANAPVLRRALADGFGTFAIVLAGIGTALFLSPQTGPLAVAIAVGLGVVGAAYAVGHISGGHFNPAVTLAAAVAGRFAWRDVLPYALAQTGGALLATGILYSIREGIGEPAATLSFAAVSNGWGADSGLNASFPAVVTTELVLTAVFALIVLSSTDRRAPSGFSPLAVGAALAMFHLVAIPISNASFSPSRALATALWAGPDAIAHAWVFVGITLLGGVLAGILARASVVRPARRAKVTAPDEHA